jgi:hypothetical protein
MRNSKMSVVPVVQPCKLLLQHKEYHVLIESFLLQLLTQVLNTLWSCKMKRPPACFTSIVEGSINIQFYISWYNGGHQRKLGFGGFGSFS